MSRFVRVLGVRLSSERFDARLGQLLCFAASPALLVVGLGGLARLALTPGEAFIGVLASLAVALLLVILGIVLPLASKAPPNRFTTGAAHSFFRAGGSSVTSISPRSSRAPVPASHR
jgi:hypothetical protein